MTDAYLGTKRRLAIGALATTLLATACATPVQAPTAPADTVVSDISEARACTPNVSLTSASQRVRSLVAQMTIDEKLGQLNQAAGGRSKSLNSKLIPEELGKVRNGEIGSYLHVAGAEPLGELQRSPLKKAVWASRSSLRWT